MTTKFEFKSGYPVGRHEKATPPDPSVPKTRSPPSAQPRAPHPAFPQTVHFLLIHPKTPKCKCDCGAALRNRRTGRPEIAGACLKERGKGRGEGRDTGPAWCGRLFQVAFSGVRRGLQGCGLKLCAARRHRKRNGKIKSVLKLLLASTSDDCASRSIVIPLLAFGSICLFDSFRYQDHPP